MTYIISCNSVFCLWEYINYIIVTRYWELKILIVLLPSYLLSS